MQGWVRTRRDSKGGFSFLELNDGSCLANIQVIADGELPNYESEIKQLSAGCSVTVEGEVKASRGKGQATEVQAAEVDRPRLGRSRRPTRCRRSGTRSRICAQSAHLRPRTNTFGAVARVRNCVCRSIHEFFQEEGFLYVHTPIITASDCEGAGEMFQVTTLDLAKPPDSRGQTSTSPRISSIGPSYLTVSGQLEARDLRLRPGQGLHVRAHVPRRELEHLAAPGRVLDGRAGDGVLRPDDNMDLAERFLKRIFRDVLERCPEDMEFFNQRIDKTVLETLQGDRRQRVRPAAATPRRSRSWKTSGEKFEFPVAWGSDLQAEHERYLTEKHFKRPVILYDYPRTIKPFYMRVNDDEQTVRAMDVLVPKVGEIIGGSQREERLDVLEARMDEQDLDPDDYWWYLDLRRYGTVPHAGFGLGLERVVQFVTGMANIRDVIPFPRTPGNAEF